MTLTTIWGGIAALSSSPGAGILSGWCRGEGLVSGRAIDNHVCYSQDFTRLLCKEGCIYPHCLFTIMASTKKCPVLIITPLLELRGSLVPVWWFVEGVKMGRLSMEILCLTGSHREKYPFFALGKVAIGTCCRGVIFLFCIFLLQGLQMSRSVEV